MALFYLVLAGHSVLQCAWLLEWIRGESMDHLKNPHLRQKGGVLRTVPSLWWFSVQTCVIRVVPRYKISQKRRGGLGGIQPWSLLRVISSDGALDRTTGMAQLKVQFGIGIVLAVGSIAQCALLVSGIGTSVWADTEKFLG